MVISFRVVEHEEPEAADVPKTVRNPDDSRK